MQLLQAGSKLCLYFKDQQGLTYSSSYFLVILYHEVNTSRYRYIIIMQSIFFERTQEELSSSSSCHYYSLQLYHPPLSSKLSGMVYINDISFVVGVVGTLCHAEVTLWGVELNVQWWWWWKEQSKQSNYSIYAIVEKNAAPIHIPPQYSPHSFIFQVGFIFRQTTTNELHATYVLHTIWLFPPPCSPLHSVYIEQTHCCKLIDQKCQLLSTISKCLLQPSQGNIFDQFL